MNNTVHPIEDESYRILAGRVDLSPFFEGDRAVVARMIHASADVHYADTVRISPGAVVAGIAALRSGAPVIADVEMTRAGISNRRGICYLSESGSGSGSQARAGTTRSASAIEIAAAAHPDGAIFVIGCAPTALSRLLELHRSGLCRPALVVGLPVGFVGAAEAKAQAWQIGLPVITNVGESGGAGVAAAACNAIIRLASAVQP